MRTQNLHSDNHFQLSDLVPDPASLPLPGLEAELCTLAGQIAAATSRFLQLLADFDAREGWAGWNIRSCAQWLSWRCGLDLRTAREYVRVARALVELPKVREYFDRGRISYSKVRAIARVATPTSEDDLLNAALQAPAAHVERLARGLRTAQAHSPIPDKLGLKPLPPAKRRRQVGWRWDDHGDLIVTGRLSAEDGARFLAAATRAAAELDSTDGSAEPSDSAKPSELSGRHRTDDADLAKTEPATARSAQSARLPRPPSNLGRAIVAMSEMVCAGLAAPIHAAAADVQVTVDIQTLIDAFGTDPGTAEDDASTGPVPKSGEAPPTARPWPGARLNDGPALVAASLRRLADDGRLRLAVLAGDGRTLDLGRTRRAPNTVQLHVLWQRDHGCSVPGCPRTRFLHAHHVVFWTHGGKTDLDNLLLLCGEHHRALHEGAFTITALGRQRFRFSRPDGATCRPAPEMNGSLRELTEADAEIDSGAIIPDWDGTPLHRAAIAGYLDLWSNAIRKELREQAYAG